MKQTDSPIAVFDSGVGGISVLRELVHLMPNENYIFFGDSKRAPYGEKTLEEVRRLTEEHVTRMLSDGAKAVVIACNTATSADVTILRDKFPLIPIIGIEPALKPAVLSAKHPNVLVMATPMTIRERKFTKLMEQYKAEAQIYPLACPGLVDYVERGELSGEGIETFFRKLFAPYEGIQMDAVVLGCTHFPFAKEAMRAVLGEVRFYDGGAGVARETKRRLAEAGLLNESEQEGQVRFESSEDTQDKLLLCQRLMKYK